MRPVDRGRGRSREEGLRFDHGSPEMRFNLNQSADSSKSSKYEGVIEENRLIYYCLECKTILKNVLPHTQGENDETQIPR